MKERFSSSAVSVFLVVVLALCAVAGLAAQTAAESRGAVGSPSVSRVQVLKGQLRKTPHATSPVVASLGYGAEVQILERREGWVFLRVADGTVSGWMYATSLAAPALGTPRSGEAAASGVSGTELVLAGKGLADTLEQGYGHDHPLDYYWVNAMLEFGRPLEDVAAFMAGQSSGQGP